MGEMGLNFEKLAIQWLNKYRQQIAPTTTARRLTSLRSFATFAGYKDRLNDYSAPQVRRGIPHPLTEGIDGVYRMCEYAGTRQKACLIALCGLVGCRVSEALAARAIDMDFAEMMLTIRGKGDKTRVVPISNRAWTYIAACAVMSAKTGKPLLPFADRTARKMVTQIGKTCKISKSVSSHDLRATFATEMLNRGHNIRTVQELLGHASVTTTELYTGVTVSNMRRAVNSL